MASGRAACPSYRQEVRPDFIVPFPKLESQIAWMLKQLAGSRPLEDFKLFLRCKLRSSLRPCLTAVRTEASAHLSTSTQRGKHAAGRLRKRSNTREQGSLRMHDVALGRRRCLSHTTRHLFSCKNELQASAKESPCIFQVR